MKLRWSIGDLIAPTREGLALNDFRQDCFMRPTAYKSAEEIGVRLTGVQESLPIYALPYGTYIPIDWGLRCMVSSWRRISESALPARAKITGSHVNSALAKSEALDNGYDEAIVLGMDGHVSEGSAENLFMFRDGVAITPQVTDDILEGVTRSAVMDLLSNELGVPVVERAIDRTELYSCDELIFCGTAAQVVAADSAAVRGRDTRRSHWLTPLYGR